MHTYQVVINTHDGLPSSYKGVRSVIREPNNFLALELAERTVYINLTEVVTYSVRKVDEGKEAQNAVVRQLRKTYTPEAVPTDDFPEGGVRA